MGFVVEEIQGHVRRLAEHECGCRVLQRLLEFLSWAKLEPILQEVLQNIAPLSRNKYGNYVVQQALQRGRIEDQKQILAEVLLRIVVYATNKYSSRVVERCIEVCACSDHAGHLKCERDALMHAILSNVCDRSSALHTLASDQYGNYVVQQALRHSSGREQRLLLQALREIDPSDMCPSISRHVAAALEKEMVRDAARDARFAAPPLSHGG